MEQRQRIVKVQAWRVLPVMDKGRVQSGRVGLVDGPDKKAVLAKSLDCGGIPTHDIYDR
jgi:hypothetical protein